MTNHQTEVDRGQRFQFGRNWAGFVSVLDEERIDEAEKSLCEMLGRNNLDGLTFLDVGSGSGLFSLAANRLGARVHSFDYDPQSVAVTQELRSRYGRDDSSWKIDTGSILDENYVRGLGQFDVVYSWGVLHHTGDMWQAMQNIIPLVKPGGMLFVALYNDQGVISRFWAGVKRLYCSGLFGRILIIPVFFTTFAVTGLLGDLVQCRNPLRRYKEYRQKRGMSLVYDWIDWLGGYPYQVAKPGDVLEFCYRYGFSLIKLVTRQTLGCNEFIFQLNRSGQVADHASNNRTSQTEMAIG
jgi:SAM-dependent methyltransferase